MALYNPENTLSVTKGAIAQLISKGYMGEDYELSALSDEAIVDLGEKLEITEDGDFSTNTAADIVYKAFLMQLGKIVIDTRAYVAKLPKLFVDPVNWGLFTENVMIDLSDVMIDEMWNPNGFIPWGAVDSSVPPVAIGHQEGARIAAIEYGFYRPEINVKIYKRAHACMVALTTTYDQLFTAFKGVNELNRFLAGLYNSVENTLQLKAEIYAKMAVSYGIARSIALNHGIDLRQIAINAGLANADTLTADELRNNADFERLSLQAISETMEYIRDYTALYNSGDIATFASDVNAILLTGFEKACKFNVRANTFNEKLIGIGDYDTITKWQAAVSSDDSTPYNFATASSIDLSKSAAIECGLLPSDTQETHALIPNVVAVIYDRLAMGITVDKRKVTTNYAASRDSSNSFYHSLINYTINDNYPIVSFYISEPDGD